MRRPKLFDHENISRVLYLHVAGVFVVSIVVILLFWAVLPSRYRQNESTDYLYYYEPVARNLLRGVGLVQQVGLPATSNPPAYSIFLAGIFALAGLLRLPEDLVHSVFILTCMGLSAVFIFLLSRKNYGLQGAWLSALFFITCPFVLWLTKQPTSEVPFMLVFYAGLYLFWTGLSDGKHSGWLLFLSGMFMGIAMLLRGIALGSAILLFAMFLWIRRDIALRPRFLLAAPILLGSLVSVLPWQVWVYRQTEQIILLGTNSVPSIRDGLTFAVNTKGYRQSFGMPGDVLALQEKFMAEGGSMNSIPQIWERLRAHLLLEPLTVVKLVVIKTLRSWYGTDSGSMEMGIAIVQLLYAAIVLIASALLWKHRAEHPGLLLMIWSFTIYFWIMTTLVLSILRYMTPVFGLLALLIPSLMLLPKTTLIRLRVYR